MSNPFFDHPILNSPYDCPQRHWELDAQGQPTQQIIENRRRAEFITPIPKPNKRKGASSQQAIVFDEGKGLSTQEQQYDPTSIINEVRHQVQRWRALSDSSQWQVTPETARLLQHWRHHKFNDFRPFFCQVEAAETAIWLSEVAPHSKTGKRLLQHLEDANNAYNPELMRLALKLATGAGKTTVMAMLIACQTINAAHRRGSKHFTRGFLVVAPGITIKDRQRVLQPNDPDSYNASRELVPGDMLGEVNEAKIVITNYHAFKLRERVELSKGGRSLLHLFGQLKRIAKQWLDGYLVCKGGTYPAQLKYQMLADMACERITRGITTAFLGGNPIKALLDPYNPTGSTQHVRFTTSKTDRWETDARRCHINWVILDSDWEAEFCRVAESHPKVRAYVKNHNLGLEVPYRYGSETRKYLPDFIVLVDDGHGDDDLLHLIVEIKGYRREDAKEKKSTMDTYSVPGVNHLQTFGSWAFAEFTDVYQIAADFKAKVESEFAKIIASVTAINPYTSRGPR